MSEVHALCWLDRGLYKLIFRTSVAQAVMDAEHTLLKAKSSDVISAGTNEVLDTLRRLDLAMQFVLVMAREMSHRTALFHLLAQLLLLTTVKSIMQWSNKLKESMRDFPESLEHSRQDHIREEQQLQTPTSSTATTSQLERDQVAIPVRVVRWTDITEHQMLGKGSFGRVVAASLKGGTMVAIKCLEVTSSIPLGLSQQEEQQEQQLQGHMEKEVALMLANQHPNIVRCLGILYNPPAIIMELCGGGSLHKQVQRCMTQLQAQMQHSQQPARTILTPIRVLRLLQQVAAAMDFMHSTQDQALAVPHSVHRALSQRLSRQPSQQSTQVLPSTLHCDLRSPNVLLAGHIRQPDTWCAQVADFGMAQWVQPEGETALTDTITNRLWVAPEVLHSYDSVTDSYTVSKAADVYSFGCLVWEVLTRGKSPFQTDDVHPISLQYLAAWGNPAAELGRLQWPDELLLSSFKTKELLQLQGMFEACTDPDPSRRPRFDAVNEHLLNLVKSAAQGVIASRTAAGNSVAVATAAADAPPAVLPPADAASPLASDSSEAAAAAGKHSVHVQQPQALLMLSLTAAVKAAPALLVAAAAEQHCLPNRQDDRPDAHLLVQIQATPAVMKQGSPGHQQEKKVFSLVSPFMNQLNQSEESDCSTCTR